MKNGYLIGVDIGTSSIKVAAIDTDANLIGIVNSSYNLINENENSVEIDTESMWQGYIKCLKKLFLEKDINPKYVLGIGISSLCPGLTALDRNGNVLVNPIIYSDRRSTKETETIKESIEENTLFNITANKVMAGAISATSMLWIKNNMPEKYQKTKYFGHVNTLLAYRMTGNFAIDYSNASYTSLFETVKGENGKWSDYLCEKIGIDKNKLPSLMSSSDVVGSLINKDLITLGIPKDTPVVIGGGDTSCATFATGVVKNGDVCESVGTTNVLTVCVDKPKFDKSFINRCHVVNGTWIYQGAMSHIGSSYQWFRDNFCADIIEKSKEICIDTNKNKTAYQLMDEEAAESLAGSGGVVFLPYMLGERSPVWDPYAKGIFFGLSLHTKRKDFIRAIMESAGYGLRQLCEITEKLTGVTIKEFDSIGGGSKSKLWARIKADITGKNIRILNMNEMSPIGAALLAGVGSKVFESVKSASNKVKRTIYEEVESSSLYKSVYEKRYQVYVKLYPQIKELYLISIDKK